MSFENLKETTKKINRIYETYLIFVVMAFFVLGIFIAGQSQDFANAINHGMSKFLDGYTIFAPLVIFVTLAAAMGRIFNTRELGRFWFYTLRWFATRRVLSCFWAIAFTALVFRLPLFSSHSITPFEALSNTFISMAYMITHSSNFAAIFLAFLTGILSGRSNMLSNFLEKIMWGIEYTGAFMLPLVPPFMMVVGAYIQSLPDQINNQFNLGSVTYNFKIINIIGLSINPNQSSGMILTYVIGSILIGIACLIFHLALVFWTKYKTNKFSLRSYFTEYFPKMYPMLWSTSSETLALPLCLHLTKELAPFVKKEVRRFVISMGNNLDSNGTIINVYVLLGLVAVVLGYPLSIFELLACIPVVFLIGYAIPGIPGELVLFALPLMELLNLPKAISPIFLVLYTGLQIGLPDSFRTAANLMDDYLNAILLNEIYEERVVDD